MGEKVAAMSAEEIVDFLGKLVERVDDEIALETKLEAHAKANKDRYVAMNCSINLYGLQQRKNGLVYAWETITGRGWLPPATAVPTDE